MSKNSYLMLFYEINICKAMIIKLHTVYNKHEILKIGKSNQRKIESTIANARIILLLTVRLYVRIYANSNVMLGVYKKSFK